MSVLDLSVEKLFFSDGGITQKFVTCFNARNGRLEFFWLSGTIHREKVQVVYFTVFILASLSLALSRNNSSTARLRSGVKTVLVCRTVDRLQTRPVQLQWRVQTLNFSRTVWDCRGVS